MRCVDIVEWIPEVLQETSLFQLLYFDENEMRCQDRAETHERTIQGLNSARVGMRLESYEHEIQYAEQVEHVGKEVILHDYPLVVVPELVQ